MTAINEKLLEDRLGTLEAARSWSPRVVSRLEALIRSGEDDALFRVNPIKFASDKGMAEAETIDLFLYATAHGLFEMNWMLLCSQCGCVTESFSAILPFGIGYLAVDGPGTGQNPIKVSETANRMLSRVIDYAQSRPEVDKNRLAMHGVSWGAYWATKMAIVEHARLRGCSAQSPPVDKFFQKDFLMSSLVGNREYLFDQIPALMSVMENIHTLDEMADFMPKLSLVHQSLLGKPMSPMLILAGVNDTQVPIDDEYLLLSKGDVPKDAWINPSGGHLGRQVGVWPDPRIFKEVIIPWLVKTLQSPAN